MVRVPSGWTVISGEPGSQPATVPVVLGDQQLTWRRHVVPAKAPVLDLDAGLRGLVKRSGQPVDLIPELGLDERITAVLRLGPDEAGRHRLLPRHHPRAGRHTLPGHLVADWQIG